MPFRQIQFAPGEHYHICVRGNNKQPIFHSKSDYVRFLFLTTHLQSPENIDNTHRIITEYLKTDLWKIEGELRDRIIKTRYVALEAFAFMGNHAHLAVREEQERGITRYMQRILNAYAKYFNTKYETVGHLFQGPFRAVHIANNDQLLYLSTYIHRNPRELRGMQGKEHQYQWSSYQDYIGKNRFGELLDTSLVAEQFSSSEEYKKFVDESVAKEEKYLFDPF